MRLSLSLEERLKQNLNQDYLVIDISFNVIILIFYKKNDIKFKHYKKYEDLRHNLMINDELMGIVSYLAYFRIQFHQSFLNISKDLHSGISLE